jgi:SAM-dependent methyltransferase
MGAHTEESVKAHYAELAGSYNAKANQVCQRAYEELVRTRLAGCERVLEIGAGASDLLEVLGPAFGLATDISFHMLAARQDQAARLCCDAAHLPCADASVDAVFSINVLEHAPNLAGLVAESARVLRPGGKFLAVTPNGDVEWLLDLLETLKLKLPEGPHDFLTTQELAALAGDHFDVLERACFLAFPAGPQGLVRAVDRMTGGFGLFQYVLWERRA